MHVCTSDGCLQHWQAHSKFTPFLHVSWGLSVWTVHSRPVGGRSCFQWQLYRSREDSNRQWENQICTNKQPQIVHSDTIVFQICNIYTKHCDSKHIMVRWKRHKMGQFKQHRLYNMILLVLWRVFPFLFDKLQWILKHNQSSLENHQPRLCDSRALNPCPPLEFQMWCLC